MQKLTNQIPLLLILGLVGLTLWQATAERADSHEMVGVSAGEFTLPLLGSHEQVGPQDFRGKVVLLDFWALYCVPCRDAMPELQRVHEAFRGRDFRLLSVNVDPLRPGVDRPGIVTEFLQRNGYTFPVVLDYGPASEAYNVTSIPRLVLIDRTGQVRFVHTRAADFEDLRDEIEELL